MNSKAFVEKFNLFYKVVNYSTKAYLSAWNPIRPVPFEVFSKKCFGSTF